MILFFKQKNMNFRLFISVVFLFLFSYSFFGQERMTLSEVKYEKRLKEKSFIDEIVNNSSYSQIVKKYDLSQSKTKKYLYKK